MTRKIIILWLLSAAVWVSTPLTAAPAEPNQALSPVPAVTTPPPWVVEEYRLDPFYTKYLNAYGIAVTSSEKTADAALHEVRYLIEQALRHRPDILKAMVENQTRIVVIGAAEEVSGIPEYHKADPQEAAYQNRRVRGYGGAQLTSCAEENLLHYDGDRYRGESIFLHEFAHCIHFQLQRIDPDFQTRLDELYARATEKGLWDKTYAATNATEYWAEGVQSYWDCNQKSRNDPAPDGVHNHVNTREELKLYDPDLFALIDQTLGPMQWRYTSYINRHKKD